MSDSMAAETAGVRVGVEWRVVVGVGVLGAVVALAAQRHAERAADVERVATTVDASGGAAVALLVAGTDAVPLEALRTRVEREFGGAPRVAALAFEGLAARAADAGDLRRAEAAQREAVLKLVAASTAARTPKGAAALVPAFAGATAGLVRLVVQRGRTEDAAAIVAWGARRLAAHGGGPAWADELELAFADGLAARGEHARAAEAYAGLQRAVGAQGYAGGAVVDRARLGLAAALEAGGRAADAEPIRRARLAQIGAAGEPGAVVEAEARLVANLLEQGRTTEAAALAEGLVERIGPAPADGKVLASRVAGRASCAGRRFGEGQRRLDVALAVAVREWGPGSQESAAVLDEVGRCLSLEGREAQARVVLAYAASMGTAPGASDAGRR